MAKGYSNDLRMRVIGFVDTGEAARGCADLRHCSLDGHQMGAALAGHR